MNESKVSEKEAKIKEDQDCRLRLIATLGSSQSQWKRPSPVADDYEQHGSERGIGGSPIGGANGGAE